MVLEVSVHGFLAFAFGLMVRWYIIVGTWLMESWSPMPVKKEKREKVGNFTKSSSK